MPFFYFLKFCLVKLFKKFHELRLHIKGANRIDAGIIFAFKYLCRTVLTLSGITLASNFVFIFEKVLKNITSSLNLVERSHKNTFSGNRILGSYIRLIFQYSRHILHFLTRKVELIEANTSFNVLKNLRKHKR